MTSYPPARAAASRVHPHFARLREAGADGGAPVPETTDIEELIDAAFWASLRREEGHSPRISLAWLAPERAGNTLTFERPLPLRPEILVRLAPAADRPGIHLGIWRENGGYFVWGAIRRIPAFCFVLEVVAPGLLVIKSRRGEPAAKYANVAVVEGDQVKVVAPDAAALPACPPLISRLLGRNGADGGGNFVDVLVELAVSMRDHGRGGTLVIVPSGSRNWQQAVVQPVNYSVSPPFSKMADLMREAPDRRDGYVWEQAFRRTVETIAGLTSVDGATIINDGFEVLAFGVKLRRRGSSQVDQVLLTEPIEGTTGARVPTAQIGGTRHLSAAQFANDQRDSVALVASQDGRFTVFLWSDCEDMVLAHRVETLLL